MQLVTIPQPAQKIDNPAVLNEYTLRVSGRPCCVHDVRKIILGYMHFRTGQGEVGILKQIFDRQWCHARKEAHQVPLGEHNWTVQVIGEILESIRREVRVERSVGGAGLENS